jgi:hypothetical protein
MDIKYPSMEPHKLADYWWWWWWWWLYLVVKENVILAHTSTDTRDEKYI